MSEYFERGPLVDNFGFPPMEPSPNPTPEVVKLRNQMQARAMQSMLGFDDAARMHVAPEEMERMVHWGHVYERMFRELFDHDASFREKVLASDLDGVVAVLRKKRQE